MIFYIPSDPTQDQNHNFNIQNPNIVPIFQALRIML